MRESRAVDVRQARPSNVVALAEQRVRPVMTRRLLARGFLPDAVATEHRWARCLTISVSAETLATFDR